MMRPFLQRLFDSVSTPTIAFFVVLSLGLTIYLPGINGPFVFDDYHNIINNPLVRISQLETGQIVDALSSGNASYPDRAISRLSFALNYYFSGQVYDARAFKLTNIVIHLINGALVFALAQMLFAQSAGGVSNRRAGWMAFLCAGVWLLHPLQLTSVLYVVQRMTSLSAMFMFRWPVELCPWPGAGAARCV